MDINLVYQQLLGQFPAYTIHKDHPLAPYTTLKIGGPADIFIDVSTPDQLVSILNFIYKSNPELKCRSDVFFRAQSSESDFTSDEGREHEKKSSQGITILGAGSNVLISDSGIRGVVIRYFDPLQAIIQKTLSQNLVGLETFAYIPASLGGAIASNIHGVDKTNFNQYLNTIKVYDLSTSTTSDLQSTDLKWGYDYSEFQNKPNLIVLSVTFNLPKGDGTAAKLKYDEIVRNKTTTQPMNSAGCVFKNPENDSAGRIIDQDLHLKGHSLGDAQVSPLHANFIVNTGNCTAKDYLSLIRFVQSTAKSKLNLDLELEIKLLGQF